jgi:hypothetical protein
MLKRVVAGSVLSLTAVCLAAGVAGASDGEQTQTAPTPPASTPALPSSPIDPYGADPNRDVGYRDEVCRADRVGRVKLMNFIRATWPVENVYGYACREINQPGYEDCDGEWEPEFSTCWSTHATGRAVDVMVGGGLNEPIPDGVALGDGIVDWFLATRDGNDHYYARTMGIQQILWNQRCWSAQRDDDRAVHSAGEMRVCGIGNHDNHPHLTLSYAGADGLTSWYRTQP